MYLTKKQINNYTCKLEEKFFKDFNDEEISLIKTYDNSYDTNAILHFLINYPEVNDKSKQYFYFLCVRKFKDVPWDLRQQYEKKYALKYCGDEIYNSYDCSLGNLFIDCNSLKQSFGCYKCKFSHHLLYCTNLRHKCYMAFNKPVTLKRFKELTRLNAEKLKTQPEFDKEIYNKINSSIEIIYKDKDAT